MLEETLANMSKLLYQLTDLNETVLLKLRDDKQHALELAASTSTRHDKPFIVSFSVLLSECCKHLSASQ